MSVYTCKGNTITYENLKVWLQPIQPNVRSAPIHILSHNMHTGTIVP